MWSTARSACVTLMWGFQHGGAEYNKNAKRLVLHQPFIFHFI